MQPTTTAEKGGSSTYPEGLKNLPEQSPYKRYLKGELGRGRIVDVHDGDTVSMANVPKSFRLRGIDAPEISNPEQPYGRESKAALEGMIPPRGPGDTRPNVYSKVQNKDKYGRNVADLMSDDPDVRHAAILNQLMVAGGHAWDDSYRPTYPVEQAKAKAAKKGLWKDKNPEQPYKARKRYKEQNK